MTTSYWDSQEIQKQFAECTTLRDVISKIESEFSVRGEVVCEIHVNGVALSENDETRFAESATNEIRELTVFSNRPMNLIRDALVSIENMIPVLSDGSLRAAEAFRGADLPKAQKVFAEVIEGCQWLVDMLVSVRGAASGIGQPVSSAERWFEAEKVIMKVVCEISDAYSSEDYVLVADLLEYELSTSLGIWKTTIDQSA